MAYHYSTHVFAGFRLLLGSAGLALATTLLLPRAGSPAPAGSADALAFNSDGQLPAPATFGLLASLPTATWLPYPVPASYPYQPGTDSEVAAVAYQPASLYPPAATTSTTSAMRRSWDTIKRMFR